MSNPLNTSSNSEKYEHKSDHEVNDTGYAKIKNDENSSRPDGKFKGLMIIKDIVDLYNNTNKLTDIPNILLNKTMSLVDAQKGAILLISRTGKKFRLFTGKGFKDPESEKSFLHDFKHFLPEILLEKKYITTDLKKVPSSKKNEQNELRSSAIYLPFSIKGKIIGVIFLALSKNGKYFNENEIDILNILIGEIEITLENNRLNRLLNKNLKVLKTKTAELEEANKSLQNEIGIRRYIEDEKEKLQSQLHIAQKLESLGTLAGGIAHNFNNLLMGIQGNATLICLGLDDENPVTKRVQNIEKLVRSGSRLTSQLLGYARKGQYEMSPINLNYIIKDICETFADTKKEITINEDLSEDLYRIIADANQIEQVLLNLFVNAADAMNNSGELFISTHNCTTDDFRDKPYTPRSELNYIVLTVKDTGEGMDEATMEKVFEPFFSTKEPGKGTGLGLASCYGIIKGHGGYIDVDSEPGKGSIFSIYLPASGKDITKSKERTETIRRGNGKILVIDDEELILEVSATIVKELGYSVIDAKSGKEAIVKFEEYKDEIDLVILDMVMPDLSGEEIYDLLRKIDPDVKVLLASGYTYNNRARALIDRGCNGFIKKPYSIVELSNKLSKITK